jgi:hypothetical protein
MPKSFASMATRALSIFVVMALPLTTNAAELLSYAGWRSIHNGNVLLQTPALQRIVARFDQSEDAKLVIRYPGGDRGNTLALELRDWFVALGVGSQRILIEPGSGIPDTMVLYVEEAGKK